MSLAQTQISVLHSPIPNSFLKLQSRLGEKWQVERLFFVGYLARQVMLEESEHKQTFYHNLQSKEMEKILGQSPKVRVIDPLRKAGVIEVNDTYSVGRFSKGYRLSAGYRQEVAKGHFQMVPIKGRAQLNRFDRWRERRHQAALTRFPALGHQLSAADHFTVDVDGLEDFLIDLELSGRWRGTELTKGRYQYLTAQAQSMTSFFSGADRSAHFASGRIHTALTNTPRDFRRYILPKNGDTLIEIDLKAAQLVFLCIAIRSFLRIDGVLRDDPDLHEKLIEHTFPLFERDYRTSAVIYAFMSTVFHDDIYTMFQDDYLSGSYTILNKGQRKLPPEEREAMKKRTFREILFSPSPVRPRDDKGPRFRAWCEYSAVMDFIHWFNESSTRNKRSSELAILLQGFEGSFFNGHVGAELERRLPECGFFIVYDALFVPERYADEVIAICQSQANKLYETDFTFTAEPVG